MKCAGCNRKTKILYADIVKKQWSCNNCINDQTGSRVSKQVQPLVNKPVARRKLMLRTKVCKNRLIKLRRGKRTPNKGTKTGKRRGARV